MGFFYEDHTPIHSPNYDDRTSTSADHPRENFLMCSNISHELISGEKISNISTNLNKKQNLKMCLVWSKEEVTTLWQTAKMEYVCL